MKKHTVFFTAGVLAACAAGAWLPKVIPEFPGMFVSAANQEITENTTLEADMTVDGDLILSGGTLNLNGHKLTVKGDFLHRAGKLQVQNGATLKITGDYQLRLSTASAGSGELQLSGQGTNLIDVDGSVYIASTVNHSYWQNNGTLRIGGDLKVWAPENGNGLEMQEGTVVTFKGDVQHEVYFEKADKSYMTHVAISDKGSLYLTGNTPGFAMDSDLTLAKDSVIAGDRKLILNGHTLTTEGNFTQNGALRVDLSGSTMTVKGDYWHKAGKLEVEDGATLKITGDYHSRSSTASAGSGELQFEGEGTNFMDVDGSVYIASTVNRSYWQNNGTLRIGGDLKVWAPENGNGLEMQDGTVVTFKGDVKHEVFFEKADKSYMNHVAMTDKGSLYLTGSTAGFTLDSDLILADGSIITGSRNLNVNGHTLYVNGSFIQDGELKVDLANGKMVVKEDYEHRQGKLELNNSTLTIGRDYLLRISAASAGSGELLMDGSGKNLMEVNRNAVFNSKVVRSYWQNNGTLAIGGDLYAYTPDNGHSLEMQKDAIVAFRGAKKHIVNFDSVGPYMTSIQLGVGDTVEFASVLNGAKRETSSAITVDPAALATVSTGANVFAFTGKTKGTGTVTFQDASASYKRNLYVVDAEAISDVVIPDTPVKTGPDDPPENQTKIRSAFEQIPAKDYDKAQNLTNMEKVDGECYCLYKNIDFDTGALSVSIAAYFTNNTGAMVDGAKGYYELRLDSLEGTVIGTVNVPQTLRDENGSVNFTVYNADITKTTGVHDLYVVFKTEGKNVILGDKWLIFSREAAKTDQPQVIRDAFTKTEAESADDKGNLEIAAQAEDLTVLGFIKNGAFALYKNVDFDDGAKYFYMQANSHASNATGGTVSLHLDAPDGKVIGSITLEPDAPDWLTYSEYFTEIELTKGLHDLYLTFSNESASYVMNVDYFVFTKEKKESVAPPEGVKRGDVNADGSIDLKDVTILRRYLAGGWNVTINEANADVNGDGSIDLKDVTILRRYLAGGWNITL